MPDNETLNFYFIDQKEIFDIPKTIYLQKESFFELEIKIKILYLEICSTFKFYDKPTYLN